MSAEGEELRHAGITCGASIDLFARPLRCCAEHEGRHIIHIFVLDDQELRVINNALKALRRDA